MHSRIEKKNLAGKCTNKELFSKEYRKTENGMMTFEENKVQGYTQHDNITFDVFGLLLSIMDVTFYRPHISSREWEVFCTS